MLEGVESLNDMICRRLSEYILAEVDELSDGCVGFSQQISSHCDEDDNVYTFVQVWVDYKVSREVDRFGFKIWRFDDDWDALIRELDRWKAGQA